VLHELMLRARGRGVRPLRDRPRRGGGRSSWHPATFSLWRTARGGGGRGEGRKFRGVGERIQGGSGGASGPAAFELVPEMGPPPSSSMPWSIPGQRACIRKAGRRWFRVRGPGHKF